MYLLPKFQQKRFTENINDIVSKRSKYLSYDSQANWVHYYADAEK